MQRKIGTYRGKRILKDDREKNDAYFVGNRPQTMALVAGSAIILSPCCSSYQMSKLLGIIVL